MSLEELPLADVAISILSVTAAPDLTLSGIDLDSGQSINIQFAGEALGDFSSSLPATTAGLVLILTLWATVTPDAA